MAGSCTATITVGEREASLISCAYPPAPVAGVPFNISIVVEQGTVSENYKLVFSGGYVGESAPFLVSAGTGQITLSVGPITIPASGSKTITASLNRV